MELRCTCGARPPEDARFCHKCGRPMYEPDPAEEETAAPVTEAVAAEPVPPPLPAGPLEISFRNSAAVRACFWAAIAAFLLTRLQFPVLLEALWLFVLLFGAGFLSVWLYQRSTKESVSVKGGLRIGWMTGVFVFCIFTVVSTIAVVISSQDPELVNNIAKQMQEQGLPEASLKQFQDAIKTPGWLGILLLMLLPIQFLFFTALSITGGLLGARLLRRN